MQDKAEYFALKVLGDSMSPRMFPNDTVIVRKQNVLQSGETGIFLINGGEATIKMFVYEEYGIALKPLNIAYETQHYTFEEVESLPIEIVGKVVEVRGKV